MDISEYIMIQIFMIPQEFVYKYNLKYKAHNGYIFERITKGVCGLPPSGWISHDALVQNLEPYVKLVLWTHDSCPIIFTFLDDDFGIKCSVK